MKTLILSVTVIFTTINAIAQLDTASFEFEGRNRSYQVFRPQNYEANMPLVINLHDHSEDANTAINYTLMNEVADTAGFMVAYPTSVWPAFYSGLYEPGWPAILKINDVGFISALIDTLKADYDIDLSRIYICGFSDGAVMSLKLAVQLGYRFAACASVAGTMLDSIVNEATGITAMPMLFCHGTSDGYVPYFGNPNLGKWSLEKTIEWFAQNNECVAEPDTVFLPDLDPEDGCTVQKISFKDCSGGNNVIFYKVILGGHSWPGGNPDLTWNGEGNKNLDINLNAEMWNFFKRYQNPLVNMAFAYQQDIDKIYISPSGGDNIHITTRLSNPENHDVKVMACIRDAGNTYSDTVPLFDDGLHDDGGNADRIYGNTKEFTALQEAHYDVQSVVTDQVEELKQFFYPKSRFTTVGPVVFDHLVFDAKDTLPNPDDLMKVFVHLRNKGSVTAARDLFVKLISLDPKVMITSGDNDCPDIPTGLIRECAGFSRLNISADCPANTNVSFALEISSNNSLFWRDTFSIRVVPDNLSVPVKEDFPDIFPNPSEQEINIRFGAKQQGIAVIEIYDASGRVVHREMFRDCYMRNHTLRINELPIGNYYVKISTTDHTTVKKLVRIDQ